MFWLTSSNELIHFNPDNGSFKVTRDQFYPAPVEHLPNLLQTINNDRQGRYWLGTWGGGLRKFGPKNNTFLEYKWINTKSGNYNIVTGIAGKDKDHLWVTSFDEGLLLFHIPTNKFIKVKNVQGDEEALLNCTSIMQDRDDNTWIIANRKLIRIRQDQNQFHFGQLSDASVGKGKKEVNCFFRLPGDSFLMIGTTRGLHLYNLVKQTYRVIQLTTQPDDIESIQDIYCDTRGRIWISAVQGVFMFNKSSMLISRIIPPLPFRSLFDESFYKVIEDNQDRLWFASRKSGLFCFNQNQNQIIRYSADSTGPHQLAGNEIISILPDSRQNTWFGMSASKGAGCITKNGDVVYFNLNKKIPRSNCQQFLETQDHHIFFPIMHEGVFEITDPLTPHEKIRQYTDLDGMAGMYVAGMTEDQKGNLWFATRTGISCFQRNLKRFQNYYIDDGLKDNFSTAIPYCDQNGWLYFGFPDGFNYFHPDSLGQPGVKPGPVFFESLRINQTNYSLNPDYISHLSLPYYQNNITLEFASLDLIQGQSLQYAYKLDGSDTGWNQLGKQRQLFFSRLSPGHYTLRLKAVNTYGKWSDEFSLPIVIKTPWWKGWWFIGLCSLIMLAIVYTFFRIRIQRLKALYQVRNIIARDLHDEIGSTLTSIHILSKVAGSNLEKDSGKVSGLLQKIKEQSQNMQQSMSDIVWAIRPDNDKLEYTAIRMREFLGQTAEARNIQVEIETDETILKENLTMQQRRDLFLIFKEAVNNAVKYSNGKKLVVFLGKVNNHLLLSVQDDGIGFNTDSISSGSGLRNMQERAKELQGELTIYSSPGQGTRISLSCPTT